MRRAWLVWVLGVLWCSCAASAAEPVLATGPQTPRAVFPGEEWIQARPESQHVDPAKLQAAVDYLGRGLSEYGGHGTLFMARHGYAIWSGPESGRQHQIYANGLHNNVCIVVPQWDMVITRTNGGREDGAANTPAHVDEVSNGFFSRLSEAIMPDSERSSASRVLLKGNSFCDDNGPFLGLGVSYFQALRHAKYDRQRLQSNLALFASQGFNYVRILSMVSWDELEIAPVTFTNRAGRVIQAWPDYWQQFRDLLDLAAQYRLRVEVTIFADAQDVMPDQAVRQSHVNGILANIAGREQHIIHLEVANEAWQNGFPGAQGITDLRAFAKYLADRTDVLVAITWNGDTSHQGLITLYRGSAADLATIHFSRDTRTPEGGWLPVRDPYGAARLPGVPPVSSNEPIGPGSSVGSESDPIKLCSAAVFAYLSNLPAYVYHSRAGVYGYERCCPPAGSEDRFETSAGIAAYRFLPRLLPADMANWERNDGLESSAPLTVFCNDQPNRYWPDVSAPTDGCDRNIGGLKGNEFVCFPMGILEGGVTLQARRPLQLQVANPLTGAVIRHLTLAAQERFSLPQGPGAYLCQGVFLSADSPRGDNDQ